MDSPKRRTGRHKQQIKELDSSILLLTHQIETMTKDLAKKEELEQKWETDPTKKI